jgi:hypothetical protein
MEFNPRIFLRLVTAHSLRSYFEQRCLLGDFNWENAGSDVESLHAAWMALRPEDRHAVWVDFENTFGLASRRGIQTLLDTGHAQHQDMLPCMGKGALAEKAFRVLLSHPEVFQVASQFAWADGLTRHWQPRQDIPAAQPDLRSEALAQFKSAVSARYFAADGRGEYCEAEVYWRGDVVYVMIYLADHPEAVVHFEGSNRLKRSTQQRAFDVVYKYEPATGAFEIYAEGTKEFRRSLAQDFISHVLRLDLVLPMEEAPAFDLDKLKDEHFRFETGGASGVQSMQLRSMCLAVGGAGGGRITFTAPPRSRTTHLHKFIEHGLNKEQVPLQDLTVERVTIQANVLNGRPRPISVTFQISSGNTCNLKDTPEHGKIRTCLKRSGLICA